ncbi:hypothetical protein [Saccharibacillus sp. JS10]|uniref:hypothetical protein n=1 Tax=Saccharibacillus sp. JS10 TaxID=2950552 RepID=UPI00210BFFAC|nr:hypothetical protein [Saccharibacillus sp. JS10]MCQ4087386.1 hypothetical protein [Saccharibacillus sp. JS10]
MKGNENTPSEVSRFLAHIGDWTEDLLLRGSRQFVSEDARRLEAYADEAGHLGMELLEKLLRDLAQAGEKSRFSTSSREVEKTETFSGLFFRICGYIELARQSGGSVDETSASDAAVDEGEEEIAE